MKLRAIWQTWVAVTTSRRAEFAVWAVGVAIACAATTAFAASAKGGFTKALLFRQPNASEPASILLPGLDGDVLQDYSLSTLVRVPSNALASLVDRAKRQPLEIEPHDEFDKIYSGGNVIDARLGTVASIPGAKVRAPYLSGFGAYVVQFIGPIVEDWFSRLRSVGAVVGQYLPYNACIVAADVGVTSKIAALPFVQFVDVMHPFLKPSIVVPTGSGKEEWQIEIVDAPDALITIAHLRALSERDGVVSRFSPSELRFEGTFETRMLPAVLDDPLVIAVAHTPHLAPSDERTAMSLTSNIDAQGNPTHAGRYKKWLGDVCEVCGSLQNEDYWIGFADSGIDGGRGAGTGNGTIPNEPSASGAHRAELGPERIRYGTNYDFLRDTTTVQGTGFHTLHDTQGHGTLITGVAAGDSVGTADTTGFFLGTGVAPTAGIYVSKAYLANDKVEDIATLASEARTASPPVYVQNHSYNQYIGDGGAACGAYFDGYYSTVSRDFDHAVRDSDSATSGNQQITLTVSAGNVSQEGSSNCHDNDRTLTLPPATAKNVIAVGMAESVRVDPSFEWGCYFALSQKYSNVASNTKRGTAIAGWIKPDLMAAASDISQARSSDAAAPFCFDSHYSTYTPASLPDAYRGSTGTSFAAPMAAGAALLASRYYAATLQNGNAGSASPALVKAMLIAGAKSMRGGLDRSAVHVWSATDRVGLNYHTGDLVIPRIPNGHVYRADLSYSTGESTQEPVWPQPNDPPYIQPNGLQWNYDRDETTIGLAPNQQQGFGRLSLEDVLSTYPSRVFVNEGNALSVQGSPWEQTYRVHDGNAMVRVVLVWTDPEAQPPSEALPLTVAPLVNHLQLSVDLLDGNSSCTTRYVGNNITAAPSTGEEVSIADATCTQIAIDNVNNVLVIRFAAAAGTQFKVRVRNTQGQSAQDFALVVYNAYAGSTAPPTTAPSQLHADYIGSAVQLQWGSVTGATAYDVQRSGADGPFKTIGSSASNNYIDGSTQISAAYVYRVRGRNSGGGGPYSNLDLATTVSFTDDPLIAGLSIKAAQITQLRSAIDAVRAAAGLSAFVWTDSSLMPQVTRIKAVHILDLRSALEEARSTLDLMTLSYPSGSILPNVTNVKAAHITEVRDGVK
jgi:hypothetical protein